MENAGKLIEEEELREQIRSCGIGTSATRGEIIKKLVTKEYISLNKKTQILTPAPFGLAVYDVVKETVPDLLSPKITANWEMGLQAIQRGEITKDRYLSKLTDYIREGVEKIKACGLS